nr:MAG TPA: hypothetical protein [Caudoviricetes sp.]
MNLARGQQHEPTEASWQETADRSRSLLALVRGGCQQGYPVSCY